MVFISCVICPILVKVFSMWALQQANTLEQDIDKMADADDSFTNIWFILELDGVLHTPNDGLSNQNQLRWNFLGSPWSETLESSWVIISVWIWGSSHE